MNRIDAEFLYGLLPALERLRDHARGGSLRELLDLIAEQAAIVQEGIEQAYDDQFIETCAEWVVPYIGDLVGARGLDSGPGFAIGGRAVVANTLAYRRRKGTLAVVEQLARDVTGYPAVAVEFFQRLAATQFMNHPRPGNLGTVDLRRPALLARIDTAFDRAAHLLEARRLPRGRYNIPNIGVFLFRLVPFAIAGASAARLDDRRYLFDPLGIDAPLFNRVESESEITGLAGERNVPMPISRSAMAADPGAFYGADASVQVAIGGAPVPANEVSVCDLSDLGDGSGGWAHAHPSKVGIDPVLGRLTLPTGSPPPADGAVTVTFRHGFSDAIGGGPYDRSNELAEDATFRVPDDGTLAEALAAASGGAVVEIRDSRTHRLPASATNLSVDAGRRVEVRAADGRRPVVSMVETPDGGDTLRDLTVEAGDGASVVLSGLVVTGGAVSVRGTPASVALADCTLVPGLGRTRANEPTDPGAPSLTVSAPDVEVLLRRCITGPLRVADGSRIGITRSIVDACDRLAVAYAGPPREADAPGTTRPGGALTIDISTVIGRVEAQRIDLASNSIFVAEAPDPSAYALRAAQTQEGCVRFCFLPARSLTPRRHRCRPSADDPSTMRPRFSSLTFGHPGYAQLAASCPDAIRRGADDESEMGAFHDLYAPHREANLRIQLEEYLRFGLLCGVFYGT